MQKETLASKIQILSPLTAERIAAGEVIERPASVVKELVENALDAGATEISVRLEDGGKALIEVTDNGDGMNALELELCFKRHATSKLRSTDDLLKLTTLGFRGEALPSIAAVSELTLISRAKNADATFEVRIDLAKTPTALPISFGHFLTSPHGTRITATGLFSQIPARLKFLKSQSSEVSAVRDWIERLALTRPDVGFLLTSDSRTLLKLRPETVKERVLKIVGDGDPYPVQEVTLESALTKHKISAYVIQGLSLPNTRKLFQVVNGRVLKDRLLQQAALHAFKQSLLPGQFPAACFYLSVDPSQIDINIHPTKTEVRFFEPSKVFHTVESAFKKIISTHDQAMFIAPSASFGASSSPNYSDESATESSSMPFASAMRPREFVSYSQSQSFSSAPALSTTPTYTADYFSRENEDLSPLAQQSALDFFGKNSRESELLKGSVFKGILFQTYFLFEKQNEMILIDQHAAHERIRFESLKKKALSQEKVESQSLLVPEVVTFPKEKLTPAFIAKLELLSRLGFEVEVFGDEKLLFRALPSLWGSGGLSIRLKNLIERLDEVSDERELVFDEALFEKLAMEACRSSVKSGDTLSEAEARSLTSKLFLCDHPWNCPHGRPTVARIPESKIEEWFQRRV